MDPISPAEMRQAASNLFHEWWVPMIEDSARLHKPGYQVYAVLTMPRMLFTLEHGTVATKSAAAKWAIGTLDKKWAALVHQALLWRDGQRLDHLSGTLSFLKYMADRT